MKHIYSKNDLKEICTLDSIVVHHPKEQPKVGLFGGLEKKELVLIHIFNKKFVKNKYLMNSEGEFHIMSAMNYRLSKNELKKYALTNPK